MAVARHSFYKLVDGTIEIDGVRMHQTKNISPLQDAKNMAALLRLQPGEKVLDVCTGLGYTSIAEVQAGAFVTTIEADDEVLKLARQNPASAKLFGNKKIKLVVADANDAVTSFPDNSFDAVLHDPPRFSFAGELYSLAFYQQLFRVLKAGGRLFHYTGRPGEKSGKSFTKGVKQRLQEAGFADARWMEREQGFFAFKPNLKQGRFK